MNHPISTPSQFANIERGDPLSETGQPTTGIPAIPRRIYSERLPSRGADDSAYPERNHDLPPLPSLPSLNSSQDSESSTADRKRRLTATSETGRRRTTTGGFTSRDNQYRRTPRRESRSEAGMAEREVIDLTGSSPVRTPQGLPPRPPRHRTPSNTSRGYVPPRWQPDHEVNECPICKRPFSFLFRRHHCRKCGRVVCNECSPHRITIPRQYIVHPAGTSEEPLSPEIPTIDLTRGEDDAGTPRRRNSALGGGEKVRLCNPCVPDPQPELLDMLREGPTPNLRAVPTRQPSINRRTMPGSYPASASTFGQRYYGQMPHPGTRLNLDHREGDSDSNDDPFASPARFFAQPNRGLPIMGSGHTRFHSLDGRQNSPLPPLPPLESRPRPVPLNGAAPSFTPSHGHPGSNPVTYVPRPMSGMPARSQQRLREEDLCPVCHRILVATSPDEREQHIKDCVESHFSSSGPRPEPPQPLSSSMPPQTVTFGTSGPTLPVASSSVVTGPRVIPAQMVRFTATEKDCTPQTNSDGTLDPSTTECSICMVEYEVGDKLVRLECWCKFHQDCIVEWFGRKAECPVHKLQ